MALRAIKTVMPFKLSEFKDYCNMPVDAQPGALSTGIVTVRRADIQTQNIIPIPIDTVFSVATGQSFKNPEMGELNQSQTFIPLLLQSSAVGFDKNIPAGSEWNTPIAGITLENSTVFSGGADPIEQSNTKSVLNQVFQPSDFVLRLTLNQSISVCMGIIGSPTEIPTTETFKGGVFFYGRYLVETRSKVGRQTGSDITQGVFDEKEVNPGIEDSKVHEGVMRILTGMLTPDRAVTAFLPEVDDDAG